MTDARTRRRLWFLLVLIPSWAGLGCAGLKFMKGPLLPDIEVEDGSGKSYLELDATDSIVKLGGARGKRLADFRLKGRGFEIQDARERSLGFMERTEQGLRILDRERGMLLWELRVEPGGDVQIRREHETYYEIKVRDYGSKIVLGDGAEHARVRVQNGKISVKDCKGKTRLTTDDDISPVAFACFALDRVPLILRGAMAVGITVWELSPD